MPERIVCVRSDNTAMSMPCGTHSFNVGSSALMASTVSMTLEPGCLKMTRITAGLPLYQPAARRLSTPRSTFATSPSRTTAPFFDATTTPR